jgi:hypothetical protein
VIKSEAIMNRRSLLQLAPGATGLASSPLGASQPEPAIPAAAPFRFFFGADIHVSNQREIVNTDAEGRQWSGLQQSG